MYHYCAEMASNVFNVPEWAITRTIVYPENYASDGKFGVTGLTEKEINSITKNKANQEKLKNDACLNIMARAYLDDKIAGVQVSWNEDFFKTSKPSPSASTYPLEDKDYSSKIDWNRVNHLMSLQYQSPLKNICINASAVKYHIPYYIWVGILKTESGMVGHISPDANGSYDIGPAQVNSIHLPSLEAEGITRHKLLWNACVNVFVGAKILSEALRGADINNPAQFWEHVGDYNSATPYYNHIYSKRVFYNIKKMFPDAFD